MRFDVRTSAHFVPNREALISMKELSVHASFLYLNQRQKKERERISEGEGDVACQSV